MSRLDTLRTLGIDLYPARPGRTHTVHDASVTGDTEETLVVSGRLLAFDRTDRMGTLHDATGLLALCFSPHALEPESEALLAVLEAGDLIECTGRMQSDRLAVQRVRLLAPSLRPSPDPALITPSALALRTDVLRFTRQFFDERGFLAVDTPTLMRVPELTPAIRSFRTEYRDDVGQTFPLYLQTSPEHYMKRLLAAGYERVYQICRFFRNGERLDTHSPEFTGLEWYEAYADYHDIMRTTEELIASLAIRLFGEPSIRHRGQTIDVSPPWPRQTVRDVLFETARIDLHKCTTLKCFRLSAQSRGVSVGPADTWDDIFHRLFIQYVEPLLPTDRPIFLTEYPARLPSLAKRKPGEDRVVERFELYIGGLELANAFTELNDPAEQRARFEAQLRVKREQQEYDGRLDEDLLSALESGMPPSGGIALGLDRLIMLFADAASIDEVIPFGGVFSCVP